MHFTKMQGIGNDYIYVDGSKEHVENAPEVARKISDRHFGIGSDGLIIIQPSDKADFEMEMYNADGSRGRMCGNGIRCVAKYVYDHGMVKSKEMDIDTLAGVKHIVVTTDDDGKVKTARVDMGAPLLIPDEVPVDLSKQANTAEKTDDPIGPQPEPESISDDLFNVISENGAIISANVNIAGGRHRISCVSMGNPHCVLFVENDVKDLDLNRIGPHFEHDPIFPDRVNTEFVQVIDDSHVKMRVWERGSGETLACGTGACAVGVASILNGYTKRELTVSLLGGDLKIEWDKNTGHVFLTGAAETVFEGDIDV